MRHRLGESGRPQGYSLSGSMLVEFGGVESHAVRWWDLAAGTRGTMRVPAGYLPVGAAPDGWVAQVQNNQRFTYETVSTAGTVRELGNAFPEHRYLATSAGPRGLIVSLHGDATDFLPFDAPGHTRTLVTSASGLHHPGSAICGSQTFTRATCWWENTYPHNLKKPNVVLLLSLTSGLVLASHGHCLASDSLENAPPGGPGVGTLGTRAAWINCHGQLQVLNADGATTTSARTFSQNQNPIAAFGRIVIADNGQQTLVTMSGAHGKPHTLATTH